MLSDKEYRKKVVDNITDPSVRSFWVDEFAKYTDKFAAEATPAIQNKVGQFTSNPIIRNIIGQPKSSFDLRDVMDKKKILIMNLSKGLVGEQNANLLGGMLITKIYLGAMSRADVPAEQLAKLPNFYFYVDEFQSFANASFADILSEARKYKLNLTIAHQYVEQMAEEVKAAVFGNVGTMIVFRVGATDAEIFEKEFAPMFVAEDIVNLGLYQMYLRLMINGVGSKPFSARGMPPLSKPEISFRKEILEFSRSMNARPREKVEVEIMSWLDTKPKPTNVEQKSEYNKYPPREPKVEPIHRGSDFVKNNNFQNQNPVHDDKPKYYPQPQPKTFVNVEKKEYIKPTEKEIPKKEFVRNKPPVKEYVHKPSPKLQEFLKKLEDTKDTEEKVVVTEPEIKKETIPLASLRPITKDAKKPSIENMNSLKSVLAEALKNSKHNQEKKTEPVVAPKDKEENTVAIKVKEVPEEVLRKVLQEDN